VLAGLSDGERVLLSRWPLADSGAMDDASSPLGISGRIARSSACAADTADRARAAAAGAFAVLVTPKEEEPQINVTMANVIIPFPARRATTCTTW